MTQRLGTVAQALGAVILLAQMLVFHSVCAETLAGWIEQARLDPGGLVLDAKLDTGAENSSLHAPQVHWFERSNEDWVRFHVADRHGKRVDIERPVMRTVRIKRHAGRSQERPVVLLGICVGSVYKEVEVNLVDRSKFEYPLLLGRSFLAGDLVVDSARRYTRAPACPTRSGRQ